MTKWWRSPAQAVAGNLTEVSAKVPPLIYITTAPNDADLVEGLGPEMAVSVPVPTDVLFSGLWDHDVLINIAIERSSLPERENR